jgi:hypothetical protein
MKHLYTTSVLLSLVFTTGSFYKALAQSETQNPTGGNAGPFWKTLGNATTNSGVNFIGTTDAVDFVVRTNNTERARVTSAGNVGIGIVGPLNKVDIAAAARSGSHGTGQSALCDRHTGCCQRRRRVPAR